MSTHRSGRLAALFAVAFVGSLALGAVPASATVTGTNILNLTGTASGDSHLLHHVDTGQYVGAGQIGIGRYRFESAYTPGGCVDATYTGTAEIVRSDGATLSGTLAGNAICVTDSRLHTPPFVQAHYTLDLTSGTRDLLHAKLDVDCSWPGALNVSGGSAPTTCTASGDVTVTSRIGYAMIDDHGGLHSFGGAPWFNIPSAGPTPMRIAMTPSHDGYWTVNSAGHVLALGDATSFGSASGLQPMEVVRGIAPTATGDGYWLFTSLGRVLPFGAATSFGDLHALRLNQPIVGAAAAPDGKGYWMVASDGGVFAFGSARFFGSTGNIRLNQPVIGFAPTIDGRGYWLAASDGGVFSFGDAPFRGSMGGTPLNQPVTAVTRYGGGYLLVASDAGVFNFGTFPFFGSDLSEGSNPVTGVVAMS